MVNRNLDGCYFRIRRGEKYENQEKGDLTTGSASLIAFNIPKERFNQIFNQGENKDA